MNNTNSKTTTTTQQKKYDIFLSYHLKNQIEVIKLHCGLVKYFRVWLDIVELKFGDNLNDEIETAIKNSSIFVCCLNNDYLTTDNCKYELIKAKNENKTIYVLPFEQQLNYIHDQLIISEYIDKIDCKKIYKPLSCTNLNCFQIDREISSILNFLFNEYQNNVIIIILLFKHILFLLLSIFYFIF